MRLLIGQPEAMPLSRVPVWQNGNAAIHAARGLFPELFLLHVVMELIPVVDPFDGRTIQRQLPEIFNKACRFAHSFGS